jgi:hypothetical protein
MNRREFSAAALATVLAPQLERRTEELFEKEGPYSGLAAFMEWWAEVADAADQKCFSREVLGNLDTLTQAALYCAITDWMERKAGE